MSFDKKNVYHSALVSAGTITVEITSDVTPSKFQGKPPFVSFKFQGQEHQYSTENQDCENALRGLKGKVVEITALGSRDDATIEVYETNQRASNAGSSRSGGGNNQRSDSRGGDQRQQQQNQAPANNGKVPIYGATAGMAIKAAIDIIRDSDPSVEYYQTADFSREVWEIASDIIRVSQMLEAGTLAKPVKERAAATTPPKQQPQQNREPERGSHQQPQHGGGNSDPQFEAADIPF